MKLILTRHGETVENKKQIIQGHKQGSLNETGMKQCKKVAERLKNEHINYIYSSDLQRSVDTAKEIQKNHSNTKLTYHEELRERNLGEYTGKKYTEFKFDNNASHLETFEAMRIRAKKIINLAYSEYPQGTVLFVGHAGINTIIQSIIEKKILNKEEYVQGLKAHSNTCVDIFEISENKNKVILLHCTKHLDN